MADVIYNIMKSDLLNANVNYGSGGSTIKLALTNGYTADADAHHTFSDVTNEVSATGYTAGGETLANKSVTTDDTNDRGTFDADDVTWSSVSITADGAVLYEDSANLICFFDFGSAQQSTAPGDFIVSWSSDGIITVS